MSRAEPGRGQEAGKAPASIPGHCSTSILTRDRSRPVGDMPAGDIGWRGDAGSGRGGWTSHVIERVSCLGRKEPLPARVVRRPGLDPWAMPFGRTTIIVRKQICGKPPRWASQSGGFH
jgi:hypothetical protein